MNVTLLGTSAAEGWPGLFCDCEACNKARQLGGKNLRTRSSALLDGVLKLDFPPDILQQAVQNGLNLRALEAILFTHAHDDHFCPSELQYLSYYFVTQPLEIPIPIYGPADVISRLRRTLPLERTPVTLHTLKPWKNTCIAGYNVTPIMAYHDPELICFNYIIEDPKGTVLLYATDTGWYEPPTWNFLNDFVFDGIVVECSKGPVEGGYMGHLCIPEVIRLRDLLLNAGALREDAPVVTTHFSHLGGLMHDELEHELGRAGIRVGYDGMNVAVEAPAPKRVHSMTSL